MAKYETNLNAATTRFWNSLYFQDNDVLENLLSPDCHIVLKSNGTGCIGIQECMKIFKEIQNRMSHFEHEKGKLRFTMKLNKVKRSARFLITPIDSTLKFNLGFQLEWECGIIIGIKVVEDPSPGFLVIKKSGKTLSDTQNTIIRQQTGPSHHEWRKVSNTVVAGVVLPKENISNDGPLESKTRYEFENQSDSTEIRFIPVESADQDKFIYPGDDVLALDELETQNSNNSKLKFSPKTHVLLVPERNELPYKELFYNASDFQLFAIDYGDEIKEIMMSKRVSPQQAIAIYHSLPSRSTEVVPPSDVDLTSTEEEKKSDPEDEDGIEDSTLVDPPSIPPVLVSSLKADIENERKEREFRNSTSSDTSRQRRGWYPGTYQHSRLFLKNCVGKFLGIIRNSVTGGQDIEEEARPRAPSVPSSATSSSGWYPGKFLGKLRGSSQKQTPYEPEGYLESTNKELSNQSNPTPPREQVPEGFTELLQTHSSAGSTPKFFIALTVLGCNNLKSPLKRVIPRPINSCVQVIVNEEAQATEIVSNNRHPRYQENNTFMFAVQPEAATEGFIEFIVTHKGLIDYEMIGMVRLPFAGISMQRDCQSPDYLLLPLTSRTPNIYSIGKGFHTFNKETISKDPSNPSLEGIVFHDSSGVDYNATEVPSLFVRVFKVNIRQVYTSSANTNE